MHSHESLSRGDLHAEILLVDEASQAVDRVDKQAARENDIDYAYNAEVAHDVVITSIDNLQCLKHYHESVEECVCGAKGLADEVASFPHFFFGRFFDQDWSPQHQLKVLEREDEVRH